MTQQLEHAAASRACVADRPRTAVSSRTVAARRLVGVILVVVPLAWALSRAVPEGGDLVNRGGLTGLGDLLASALKPSLDPAFLGLVLDAAWITVVFAALGTAGALLIGLLGGVVLSDVAWQHRPPLPVRLIRLVLRTILVAVRSVHELIWALLFVSVLGFDSLVAVLAIALPFGAQTAKVFGETLDGVPSGPLESLRSAGASPVPAMAYGLIPGASPLLLSYCFYRFECAIRSAVLLGVVGVGGLGQELVVSLQSRNWDEVWTLIWAVVALSAVVDLWSTRVRSDLAVVTCSDWSTGDLELPSKPDREPETPDRGRGRGSTSRWARWSAAIVLPGLVVAWLASGVSLGGLGAPRTRELTASLFADLWPPALPLGGWPVLAGAVLDTVAMAILAMAVAVAVSLLVGPWATRPRFAAVRSGTASIWLRRSAWVSARVLLLVLRSVPPTVWAIIALLVLFPGVLPGALALGLYTGGILGRLVAEAWESIDLRPFHAVRHTGVSTSVAALASVTPPSAHHLLTYTLYRFEICVRDTAVVGVVGAAGLGRLFAENLAVFRFPVVSTLLLASFAVSVATEVLGRRLRHALRP
ncbi:MAG: PhnE/PtxC family ABC transporter permease [Aeromicrobium sp.]